MPGDYLKKVKPGDPFVIPAKAYNKFVDLARVANVRQIKRDRVLPVSRNATIIKIKNASEEEVPRFGILGIDEPLINPDIDEKAFTSQMVMQGLKPVEADHSNKFAIALEPIEKGRFGNAIIAGVTICKVNKANAGDAPEFVDVVENQTQYLEESANGNAQVLWLNDGIGEQYAVVRIGGGGGGCEGQNELQQIVIIGPPESGTFKILVESSWTASIPYNATTTQVKDAIETLGYTVTVTGITFAYNVEFTGVYANTRIPVMVVSSNDLVAGDFGVGGIVIANQRGR